ncbi:hypothetical protein FQZ97_907350 [compost metagenome]
MSDYFAALMRASNLFAGSAAPSLEAPLEFAVEVPAPPLPAAPAPHPGRLETRAAVAASEQSMPAAPVWQPAPARPRQDDSRPATSVRQGNSPQWQPAETEAPRSEQQMPLPGAPQQDGQPRPPRADELLRATMRWVASDPQLAAPPQQAPVHPATQPDILESSDARLATVQPRTIAPVAQPHLQDAPDAARAPVQAAVPEPITVLPQVAALASLRAEPDASGASAEESLEISIGAIHLRVEAPAPQTLARQATPAPPVQQPAAPASPTRSGLSRRALRRL